MECHQKETLENVWAKSQGTCPFGTDGRERTGQAKLPLAGPRCRALMHGLLPKTKVSKAEISTSSDTFTGRMDGLKFPQLLTVSSEIGSLPLIYVSCFLKVINGTSFRGSISCSLCLSLSLPLSPFPPLPLPPLSFPPLPLLSIFLLERTSPVYQLPPAYSPDPLAFPPTPQCWDNKSVPQAWFVQCGD